VSARVTAGFRLESVDVMTRSRVWLPGSCVGKLTSYSTSYSPSVVTMAASVAVCDIFSVKEWPDLENRVRVRSTSLEMAPIDRSRTSLNT